MSEMCWSCLRWICDSMQRSFATETTITTSMLRPKSRPRKNIVRSVNIAEESSDDGALVAMHIIRRRIHEEDDVGSQPRGSLRGVKEA